MSSVDDFPYPYGRAALDVILCCRSVTHHRPSVPSFKFVIAVTLFVENLNWPQNLINEDIRILKCRSKMQNRYDIQIAHYSTYVREYIAA